MTVFEVVVVVAGTHLDFSNAAVIICHQFRFQEITCRVKSLDEDLPIVLGALNNNRMEGAPELEDGIGWEQRGPIADERKSGGQEKAVTKVSRHKQKFEDCGSPCIHNLNQYYKKDFEVLQYPMDVE